MGDFYNTKPYCHPKDDPDIIRPEPLLHYITIDGQDVDRAYWNEDFESSPADTKEVIKQREAAKKKVEVARPQPVRTLVGATSSIDSEF